MAAPLPPDESLRLEALRRLEILDTEPEPSFDRITHLAAYLYGTPTSTVSLVDSERQWFKSCIGMADRQTPREVSFCAHAILNTEPLIVMDAQHDARFKNYANVTGPPYIRFYAGAPLITSAGFAIGTLCVIDQQPRTSAVAIRPLADLAQTVSELIERRLLATHLQAAQAETAMERERLALTLDTAADAYIAIDDTGRITGWNQAAQRLFGYTRSEALSQVLSDLIIPERFRTAHLNGLLRFAQTRSPRAIGKPLELPALHRNGHELPIEVVIWPLTINNQLSFQAFAKDISDRKAAQAASQRESELNALLQSITSLANKSRSVDETLQDCVEGLHRHCRFPYARLSWGDVEPCWYVADSAHPPTLAQRSIPALPASCEGTWLHDSSPYHPEWPVALTFALTSHGEITGKLELFSPERLPRDSHLLAIAPKIGAALGHFLLRNQMQESLLQAKQAAEQANRAKSAFVAAMSHEIRTPMNAILGIADVLAETGLTAEQAKYVGIFRRAGTNLLALINSVLDLAKIEAGHFELERIPFDLPDVAAATLDLIRSRLKGDRVNLVAKVAPDVPKIVLGDPLRLQQVLTNLLGNAAKFTETGSITLLVEPDLEHPNCIRFSVTDTGIGIPAEKLSAIFDDFTQADSSIARNYGGTGLGLGIAKSLVSMMGGRIEVSSTVGLGTTFVFRASLAAAPVEAETATSKHNCDASPQQCGRHLLIAEDFEDNRVLIEAYLNNSGHQVTFARDGQEAVDLFKAGKFDLVLMDVQMPVLGGLEATATIRALEKAQGRARTPVVMLTANALSTDGASSLAAGADGHLTKPISKQKLLAAIEERTAAPSPNNRTEPIAEVPSGFESMSPDYLERRRKEIPILLNQLTQRDFSGIAKIAHNLKGTGASYGFEPITHLGEALETAASSNDLERLQLAVHELNHYVHSVKLVPARE